MCCGRGVERGWLLGAYCKENINANFTGCRVEGKVERLPKEESQIYFDVRARGSRLGAWASRQSQVIESREVLENWVSLPDFF